MEIIRNIKVLQNSLKTERMRGRAIGFVPTMGALHDGHMSLIRTARLENDILIASIFLNPIQFGPSEDFEKYPKDMDGDISKLRGADVDMAFLPDASAMYPEGFSTAVDVRGLSEKLCGGLRPGHFTGVATVIAKLFNIVGPERAYFGQKDYQQGLIIKKLVRDLNMDINVVLCPTRREPDGLAMSSRNLRLGADERKAAAALYMSLSFALEKIKSGILNVREVKGLIKGILSHEPLITDIEYASVYDAESLDELDEITGRAVLAAAVRIGDVRLIDNIPVEGLQNPAKKG
ncbi:MAG: pantoate--beta-alanine ligase [Thermodesulfovibrionales bacterium]|nr:pantoate--beta-alanine ligase [Thermodesulfovibrionales bacterium]